MWRDFVATAPRSECKMLALMAFGLEVIRRRGLAVDMLKPGAIAQGADSRSGESLEERAPLRDEAHLNTEGRDRFLSRPAMATST